MRMMRRCQVLEPTLPRPNKFTRRIPTTAWAASHEIPRIKPVKLRDPEHMISQCVRRPLHRSTASALEGEAVLDLTLHQVQDSTKSQSRS